MGYVEQFFHTPTKQEKVSSVYITWAGHRICSPDHVIGPRILDNYKIVLVIKGKGVLEQSGKQYQLSPGDMFALFPGVKHYYYTDKNDPWELIWVSFNGNICKQTMESIHLQPSQPTISNAMIPSIVTCLKNIISGLDSKDDTFALKSTGNLYILFSEIKKLMEVNTNIVSNLKEEDVIEKALTFIHINYYLHIDVDLLCNHVNYSRSYFSRQFKNSVGMTVPEYINKVRIQQAKYLLKNTDLTVSEVAKSVGFEDPFYFSKTFKSLTGLSPISYKNDEETKVIEKPLQKV